ncbi:hypothetical protein L596_016031 [Steinernema carpocapsae]|uniref:Uncharacterized protein n=1 Tax=Steinernema carpocapsae TaxID=34508 RepID=A0A4U5NHL0_STECR|nr:hypothetical protein L596_016031 [Steinernema carpocapsae]
MLCGVSISTFFNTNLFRPNSLDPRRNPERANRRRSAPDALPTAPEAAPLRVENVFMENQAKRLCKETTVDVSRLHVLW